jgi:5'(3')-deoxyribonucleotidase
MPFRRVNPCRKLRAEGLAEKTMDINKAVVAVDLDGVCADFYGRMREIVAEWFERDVNELPLDVTYGLREWGVPDQSTYESIHRFALHQRELFTSVTMIPGTRKWLRTLSNDGARIRIVTHRLFIGYAHALAVVQTVNWLDHHGIPYWDLCFMKEKRQVGADVYIDDTPSMIEQLRGAGIPTICFANSTNRHIKDPRVQTWEECYDTIRTIISDLP